jgi:hypothetical protein
MGAGLATGIGQAFQAGKVYPFLMAYLISSAAFLLRYKIMGKASGLTEAKLNQPTPG